MSEEEQALRHLGRHEKKSLVKGWNSAQASAAAAGRQRQQVPEHSGHEGDDDNDSDEHAAIDPSHLEPSDRLIQWLRQQEPTSLSSAVSSQWESQFAGLDLQAEADDEDEIPLTSGQVKHAYRTRARKEEVRQTKRAVAMKLQREKLLGLQTSNRESSNIRRRASQSTLVVERSTKDSVSTSADRESPSQAQAQQLSPELPAPHHQQQGERIFELRNLPASRICVDSELRNETLAVIRKELIAGRNVLLTSDCGSLADAETGDSLSDSKLMMQQLCAQSLMYCMREQEVVPEVDPKQQRVRLLLTSRMPWSS